MRRERRQASERLLALVEGLGQPGADGVERCAGGEDVGDALFLQHGDVAFGDDPADDHEDVAAAGVGQELDHPGHEGEVGPGEQGEPDGVGVLLHDGLDHLLGRLVEARVDDLEPGVTQGPGDDLGSPIVAVEAWLGHDDPVRTFHALPRIRKPWSGRQTGSVRPGGAGWPSRAGSSCRPNRSARSPGPAIPRPWR